MIDNVGESPITAFREKVNKIPKRIPYVDYEKGCPNCSTWDYIDNTYDIVEVLAKNVEAAVEFGDKTLPEAIYYKSSSRNPSVIRDSSSTLNIYLFLQ